MAAGVTVRDAVEADLPAITRLYNALIPTTTSTWRDRPADADEMRRWWDAQQASGRPVLVAEADGRVLGYTTWTAFRPFPGYVHTAELTIHVDGDAHGRGVGRALMDALVERGRAAGVHVLVAGIDGDNTGSIAFHRALGFVEVGRMPEVGTKHGRWLTLVLLQRALDDRPAPTGPLPG